MVGQKCRVPQKTRFGKVGKIDPSTTARGRGVFFLSAFWKVNLLESRFVMASNKNYEFGPLFLINIVFCFCSFLVCGGLYSPYRGFRSRLHNQLVALMVF